MRQCAGLGSPEFGQSPVSEGTSRKPFFVRYALTVANQDETRPDRNRSSLSKPFGRQSFGEVHASSPTNASS
jgi:hypothetical protein